MNDIDTLVKMIKESNNIVVFTGAGVSTDSGLKDFRSKDGLYNEKNIYPAEYLLSSSCFYEQPNVFYEYYKSHFNCLKYEPNATHIFLKELEDIGKLKAVVTQNIDGLHTKAGSKTVYEVHGTVYDNYCLECGKHYKPDYIFKSNDLPLCICGGLIKPKVVLYEEALPEEAVNGSIEAISKADMLMVLGSSLTVYPAAGFINYFRGKYLVIINNDKTNYDNQAYLVIHDNIAKISKELSKRIKDA